MAARSRMKLQTKKAVLSVNQTMGGRKAGPSQPPKNSVTIMAEERITPMYSPTMMRPNFIDEYSVWNPAASSCSASGRSNGRRWVSANPAMKKTMKPSTWGKTNHIPSSWAFTISLKLKEPLSSTTPMIDSPMNTS